MGSENGSLILGCIAVQFNISEMRTFPIYNRGFNSPIMLDEFYDMFNDVFYGGVCELG